MICKLKDIATVKAGNSAPEKDSLGNSGIPFVRAGSLEFLVRNESIDKCEKIGEVEANNLKLKLFPKGSILFAKSGMSATMGRVYQLPKDAYVVSHLAIVTPMEDLVLSGFLKYYFIGKPPLYLIKDEAYPSIKISDIEDIEIDLPDLETQARIVAILDKANALTQKRQRTIELMDDLQKAQFLAMFGDPSVNNKQWPYKSFRNVLLGIDAGWSPVCEEKSRSNDNEWAVLKQGAVSRRKFNPEENKLLPSVTTVKKEVTAQKDDLLFSRKNSKEYLGSAAYVFRDYEKLLLPDTIFKLKYDKKVISGIYLLYLINDSNYRLIIQNLRTGAAGSMPNISQENLLKHEIPVPDLQLQKKFEEIIFSADRKLLNLTNSRIQLNKLFSAILQLAFTGKLSLSISIQLNAILNDIDIQKSENDLVNIITNEEYLLSLVDRLNTQEFESQDLYSKAKHVAFQLLRQDERLTQVYDKKSKSLKLAVK